MEFEAPALDFSRLSVSHYPQTFGPIDLPQNPSPPSRTFEPIDFSKLSGSISFTAATEGTDFDGRLGNRAHEHVIAFDGNKFTVDGGPERDVNDQRNFKFLESIKNYEIPEEFTEEGLHTIQMVRTCEAYRKAVVPKAVLDKRFEDFLKFMSF